MNIKTYHFGQGVKTDQMHHQQRKFSIMHNLDRHMNLRTMVLCINTQAGIGGTKKKRDMPYQEDD